MKLRLPVCLILLSVFSTVAPAQQRRCPVLGTLDGIMSMGRIAGADRRQESPDALLPAADSIHVSTSFGSRSISEDYDFTLHLLESGLKKDALTLMCSDLFQPSDTLSYLRGWTFYNTRHLGQASSFLRQVPQESVFYDRSLFYDVAITAHRGDYDSCLGRLASYNGKYSDLKALQTAGVELLMGDFDAYHKAAAGIGGSHYAIVEAASNMANTALAMENYHPRSMVLCGLASAAVPGLGKIICGKTGEGVMAFLTVGSFAAITAENWIKCGPRDWKTILFGTLGTLFYIGNIYGTCVSVKLYNDNTIRGNETAVLVDIHIPLYSIFD